MKSRMVSKERPQHVREDQSLLPVIVTFFQVQWLQIGLNPRTFRVQGVHCHYWLTGSGWWEETICILEVKYWQWIQSRWGQALEEKESRSVRPSHSWTSAPTCLIKEDLWWNQKIQSVTRKFKCLLPLMIWHLAYESGIWLSAMGVQVLLMGLRV